MIAQLVLDLVQLLAYLPAAWAMAGYPCCCGGASVSCIQCPGGAAPRYFQLEIEGIQNDDCDDCDAMNATFIVDFEWPAPCEFFDELGSVFPGDNAGTICVWVYEASPRIACDHTCIYLAVDELAGGERYVAAYVRRGVNEWIRLDRTIDTEDEEYATFSCQFTGFELTNCTATYVSASDRCDCGAGAKATVTAM
jgi:hypothetical protein